MFISCMYTLCCLVVHQARFVQLKSRTVLVLAAFVGIQVTYNFYLFYSLSSINLVSSGNFKLRFCAHFVKLLMILNDHYYFGIVHVCIRVCL